MSKRVSIDFGSLALVLLVGMCILTGQCDGRDYLGDYIDRRCAP